MDMKTVSYWIFVYQSKEMYNRWLCI